MRAWPVCNFRTIRHDKICAHRPDDLDHGRAGGGGLYRAHAVGQRPVFSSVPTGFLGSCKVLFGVPGVQDIEIVHGTAFIAASSARGFSEADGIYALPLSGGKLTKLKGAPKDFHPRGIGTFRSPDGSGVFCWR